jgi:hypothetical protein
MNLGMDRRTITVAVDTRAILPLEVLITLVESKTVCKRGDFGKSCSHLLLERPE